MTFAVRVCFTIKHLFMGCCGFVVFFFFFLREFWNSFVEEEVAAVQGCLRCQALLDVAGQLSGAVPWQHRLIEVWGERDVLGISCCASLSLRGL